MNINPNVAKAGGLQSQGAEGEAVIIYCDPSATLDMKSSGFPARVETIRRHGQLLQEQRIRA